MAEQALIETVNRAQSKKSSIQMIRVTLKSIRAVWYQDPKSNGAWKGLENTYGKAANIQGENIQLNGVAMATLIPGGTGIKGGIAAIRQGYSAVGFNGMKAGFNAMRYIMSHEVAHTTPENNARGINPESNADNFYQQLFGDK